MWLLSLSITVRNNLDPHLYIYCRVLRLVEFMGLIFRLIPFSLTRTPCLSLGHPVCVCVPRPIASPWSSTAKHPRWSRRLDVGAVNVDAAAGSITERVHFLLQTLPRRSGPGWHGSGRDGAQVTAERRATQHRVRGRRPEEVDALPRLARRGHRRRRRSAIWSHHCAYSGGRYVTRGFALLLRRWNLLPTLSILLSLPLFLHLFLFFFLLLSLSLSIFLSLYLSLFLSLFSLLIPLFCQLNIHETYIINWI